MKKRVISAMIVLAIFIPIFVYGGLVFDIAFYLVSMLGLKELIDAYEIKRKIPDFVILIAYLLITLLYFFHKVSGNFALNIDYRVITTLFFGLLLPIVLYHDNKKYNISDAFYLVGGVFFLGCAFSLFSVYRDIGLELLVYLFLVTVLTDTFAYITGMLIGKHKLLEAISPKKTWEGSIGGSLVGTTICTLYYISFVDSGVSLPLIVGITLFLTIIGQLGDLFFSAIKRYYGIKDFSNIMPGHGGVLDRLDSIIFVILAFSLFMNLI